MAVVWVIDWLVSFTFARLGFLLAEEMKAELGQEIPCTQVFLVSPVHLTQGHVWGPGMPVSPGLLWLCLSGRLDTGRSGHCRAHRATSEWSHGWPWEPP